MQKPYIFGSTLFQDPPITVQDGKKDNHELNFMSKLQPSCGLRCFKVQRISRKILESENWSGNTWETIGYCLAFRHWLLKDWNSHFVQGVWHDWMNKSHTKRLVCDAQLQLREAIASSANPTGQTGPTRPLIDLLKQNNVKHLATSPALISWDIIRYHEISWDIILTKCVLITSFPIDPTMVQSSQPLKKARNFTLFLAISTGNQPLKVTDLFKCNAFCLLMSSQSLFSLLRAFETSLQFKTCEDTTDGRCCYNTGTGWYS